MAQEEFTVEGIFRAAGAVLEGHFLLASGLHSAAYWEKMRVLQQPRFTEQLCRPIARHFANQGIAAVAGPTLGGAVLAYEVARQLKTKVLYAERDGDRRVFREGQSVAPGERVLIVDDVLTTGGSLRQVVAAVREAGGQVVGIGVIVDRSSQLVELGYPLFACHRVVVPAYRPEECPLCRAAIPLVRLGGNR